METREIKCRCGTTNRIPKNYPVSHIPRCEKCKTPLSERLSVRAVRLRYRLRGWGRPILSCLIPIAFVGGLYLYLSPSLTSKRASLSHLLPPPSPMPPPPPLPSPNNALSLAPNFWNIHGRFVPTAYNPTAAPNGWQFSFPLDAVHNCPGAACVAVGYVTTPYTLPITGRSITITYQVMATPGTVFNASTEGDNSGDAALGFPDRYRWFSPANSVPMTPINSISSYTVSLDPSKWIGVYGEVGNSSATALAAFKATIGNIGNIGLVFGGGCFAGHGVYLDAGSATFNLLGYVINP
jgi:hypothetical protein